MPLAISSGIIFFTYMSGRKLSHQHTRVFRPAVLFRDGYTCQFCGRQQTPLQIATTGEKSILQMHHTCSKPFCFDLSHLITLCVTCHQLAEKHR